MKQIFQSQEDPVPRHATSSRWQMNLETLRNTLSYVFDKLGHNCYMLCVGPEIEKHMVLYKLESLMTPPRFNAAIQDQLSNLDSNALITDKQRRQIRETAKTPVRVLQCIMKNYREARRTIGSYEPMNEYMELLRDLILPQGVFILNLTDAIILRRDNNEPFPMVTGNLPIEPEFQHRHHLPIMSLSGQKGYNDIPIPNYDDMFIVTGQKETNFDEYVVDWDQKTVNRAVFRGGPSGCGYVAETNQRIHLISINSPLLDAKIIGKGNTIDSNSIKFDPVHGLGMLNTGIKPGNFMSMVEQSKYKYIIHVDGNVNAYRLLTTMMTGSLIIRVDSPYVSWVDHLIKPGRDYVLVRPDLSDLVEKIKWCESHPKSARKMAKSGYEFAKRALTREYVGKTIEKIFWSLPFLKTKTRKNMANVGRKTMKMMPRSPGLLPFWQDPNFVPKSPEDSPPSLLPFWKDPNFVPKSPEDSPPLEKPFMLSQKEEVITPFVLDIIEMPIGAKKCPIGYLSHTVNGRKMCKRKKNQTMKIQ